MTEDPFERLKHLAKRRERERTAREAAKKKDDEARADFLIRWKGWQREVARPVLERVASHMPEATYSEDSNMSRLIIHSPERQWDLVYKADIDAQKMTILELPRHDQRESERIEMQHFQRHALEEVDEAMVTQRAVDFVERKLG